MPHHFLFLFCFILLSVGVNAVTTTCPPSVYPVTCHIFNATIDHYNFRPTTVPHYSMRYVMNKEHWKKGGPVFFYTGNEADIFQFVNNSGFMFETAQEFGALVVFAEHRYYGLSNPFGNDYALGIPYNVSFLTVEQAMQDFNTLNVHLRASYAMPTSTAFIAFGGSYGGNLAMWVRLKNPHLWAGAIASSAPPLKHLLRKTNAFARIETEVYANVSAKCPDLVRAGWKALFEGAKTISGRISTAKALGLCRPLPDKTSATEVMGWIDYALETMVQYGYPYPSNFDNPVPGYPFKVTCEKMLESETGLGALRAASSVFYNYTGQAGSCFDFDEIRFHARKFWKRTGKYGNVQKQNHRINPLLETQAAWGYQCCTEVYQPMPTNGVTDFEVPSTPNKTAYYENCMKTWGVTPRPDWEEMTFMGNHISAGSNIFLTSGQLDPWRAAGITTKPPGSPDSIIVRVIEHAAHHLDLRAANELDPPSVTAVRNEERAAIKNWIVQYKELHVHGTEEEL